MKNITISHRSPASAEGLVEDLTTPPEALLPLPSPPVRVEPMSEVVLLTPRPDQPGDRSVTKLRMTTGRKTHVLTIGVDVRGALRGPAEVIEMPSRKSDSPESSS